MDKQKTFAARLKNPAIYLPYLAAPLSVAAIYLFLDENTTQSPIILDKLAPFLIGSAAGVYWIKAVITRNLTYVLLLALISCLFLRELHWEPPAEGSVSIKDAIYPLLGLCAIWFIAWRKLIDTPAANFSHTLFFIPALATYAIGQAIEKRMFRFLPREDVLHSWFEEAVECSAHGLILMAAIFGSWEIKKLIIKTKSPDDLDQPDSDET